MSRPLSRLLANQGIKWSAEFVVIYSARTYVHQTQTYTYMQRRISNTYRHIFYTHTYRYVNEAFASV